MFKFFFILLLFQINFLTAQQVSWEWAKHAGGGGDDDGYFITIDNDENVIIVGSFNDVAYFGAYQLVSMTYHSSTFITKMDSLGNFIWARKITGTDVCGIESSSNDSENNIYVTGFFQGTAYIDTVILICNGGADFFIAKYDPYGNVLWAKSAGGSELDAGMGIICDSNNIYVCGELRDTIIFDSIQINPSGILEFLVASLDLDGNYNWIRHAGGPGWANSRGIAIDNNSNILVTGLFGVSIEFSDTIINSNGNFDAYIAKYNSNGQLLWVHNMGGGGQ